MKKNLKLFMFFIVVVLALGCSENNDSDKEKETNFKSSDYYYYVSGKINGEAFIYGQRIDDTTLKYQEVSSIPLEGATCATSRDQGLDYKISYGTSIYPDFDNEDTQPSLAIDFIRFYRCSDSQSSTEAFNDLFSSGSYDFSADDASSGIMNQIGISYASIATAYEYYESYGNQSNSTFKITKSQADNTAFGLSQIIEGTFSVKLYNVDDSSDVIEITDGQFKISVSK